MTDEEKAALEEAKEAEGNAGGTGEEDEEGNEGEGTENEDGAGDGEGEEGDEGKGKQRAASGKGAAGLQRRLKQVIEQRNAYRELGTPEELKKLKERIAEYDRYEAEVKAQEKKAEEEARRKAGQPTDEELNASFDRALERRFGKGAAQDFEQFRDTQRREVQRTVRDSLEHIRTFLTEHNIKADDKAVERWSRHVGTEFKMDDELAADFRDPVTQKKALDIALNRVRAELIDPALAAVGASKLETARKRREAAPSSGGRNAQAPIIDENEEFTPPKNLTNPVERQRWWDKLMARKRRELDEASPE